jgi:hypothetical protein
MAEIEAWSLGPSKMFAPWMQRYSVPDRFAPRRRRGVVPSKI